MVIDKETKWFNLKSLFLYKLSWDFSMKEECDVIIHKWQMIFQTFNLKRNYFLNLLNVDYLSIKPTYIKSSLWLKLIDHSNFLYTRIQELS